MYERSVHAIDPSLLVFAAHGRVLRHAASVTRHFCRTAERVLRQRVAARMRRRLIHLEVAAAALRHLTEASIAELREHLRRELGGRGVAPLRVDKADLEVWEVAEDIVDGGAPGADGWRDSAERFCGTRAFRQPTAGTAMSATARATRRATGCVSQHACRPWRTKLPACMATATIARGAGVCEQRRARGVAHEHTWAGVGGS